MSDLNRALDPRALRYIRDLERQRAEQRHRYPSIGEWRLSRDGRHKLEATP